MKKYLLTIAAVFMAFIMYSCGDSQEVKSIRDAIYQQYKAKAIETDTQVPFEVPSVKIVSKEKEGNRTTYKVEFGIMEKYPSRNVYYKGDTEVEIEEGHSPEVGYLYYKECGVNELP